jgi:hypothetical protein
VRRRDRSGQLERVAADPAPTDGALAGAVQDGVDLEQGAGCERPADVRLAPVVACVRARGAVLGEPPPVAVRPAGAELLEERVQDLAVDPADLNLADERLDVVLDEPAVAVERGRLDVQHLQVPFQKLAHCRTSAGIAAFVDLGQQAGTRLLGFLHRPRAGLDRLRQVVALARQRIDPGVHADTERAARALLDLAALPPSPRPRAGHGSHGRPGLAPRIAP